MTAVTTRRDGASLVGWLALLGWHIEIERAGMGWAGSAQRLTETADGPRITSRAASYRAVVSDLYRDALSFAA